jgi:signal transduction histidine kinase
VELTGPNEDNIIPAFVERLEVPLRLTLRLVAESLKRKHAQEVLENELRGFSLASGAAVHEIRNPLGLIQFQLDFLKLRLEAQPSSTPSLAGELPAGQDFSGVFRDVNAEIDRIARHLDDLSALAQYGASELKIERQPGDLIPILRRLVERMNHKFEARGTRCTILVEVPVLEGAWDFFRIEQVLTNLLSNACKYGNGKPVSVSVTLEGDLYSSVCVIRVKDQGTGISDEDQTQILRHFFRSKSHRSQRGLGLGLYVCDKLVTLMEGRLEVQSTPNQGTEVSVRLPMTLNAP